MSESGIVIVTGAGSGIGRAAAVQISTLGFSVVLIGRREGPLLETRDLCPTPAAVLSIDLASAGAADKAIRFARAAFPQHIGIVAIINNAGSAPSATIAETTESIVRETFDINAIAPTALVAAAWSDLNLAAAAHGRASVVNVSSVATIDPFPNLYAYACAKAAMNVGALCVHREGKPFGIRGFAILPGSVETAMLRGVITVDQLPTEHTLSPATLAEVIVQCLEGKRDADSGGMIVLESPGTERDRPHHGIG